MLLKSAMYFSNTETDSEAAIGSDYTSKVKSKQESFHEDGMSTDSGHSTMRPLPSSISTQPEHTWVSIIQSNKICPSDLFFYQDTDDYFRDIITLTYGPAAGQSPATSAPTILGPNPSGTVFEFKKSWIRARGSNGGRFYRCECHYTTHRKSDLKRHREGSKHEKKRYNCTIPDCKKSYSRKYALQRHLRKHQP